MATYLQYFVLTEIRDAFIQNCPNHIMYVLIQMKAEFADQNSHMKIVM